MRELPINCIALWPDRQRALECATGQIELAFCRSCGVITNTAFEPGRIAYDGAYDNSLHFSPTFQRYADETVRSLVTRYDLNGKDIIDVGCGNGEFLALLCADGNNRGVGFDPSYIPGRAATAVGGGISIVPDYYSDRYRHYNADLVICRQVLEHIYHPRDFLLGIRAALEGRARTAVFFEMPNAGWIFRNDGIWDIIYEHCFYYTERSVARLFTDCGFEVVRVYQTFQRQYLCVEAVPSSVTSAALARIDDLTSISEDDIEQFALRHQARIAGWERELLGLVAENRRVMVWGAGAKGAMFLSAFRHLPNLHFIVDVNPHKHGLYGPGTGQLVVAPESLREYRPDVLLIMNANYVSEISAQVAALGLSPRLITI